MPAGGGDQVGHGGAAAVQHPGHGGGRGHGALTTSTTLYTLLCNMYHHTLGVRGHPAGGVPGHRRHCTVTEQECSELKQVTSVDGSTDQKNQTSLCYLLMYLKVKHDL